MAQRKDGGATGHESVTSPATSASKHGKGRMSQDFKMRILTKKKVTVPPSATS